jgi:hypothetical protein
MENVMKTRVLEPHLPRALGALMLVAGMAIASSAHADDPDDELLWSVGEFALGNGDAKTVSDASRPEPTRICVKRAGHAVPLKVDADGRVLTIAPGACGTVDAKRVSIRPGGPLDDDTVLVGRYRHVRR